MGSFFLSMLHSVEKAGEKPSSVAQLQRNPEDDTEDDVQAMVHGGWK